MIRPDSFILQGHSNFFTRLKSWVLINIVFDIYFDAQKRFPCFKFNFAFLLLAQNELRRFKQQKETNRKLILNSFVSALPFFNKNQQYEIRRLPWPKEG